MSDTPRTMVVSANFARQLERDLADCRAHAGDFAADCERLTNALAACQHEREIEEQQHAQIEQRLTRERDALLFRCVAAETYRETLAALTIENERLTALYDERDREARTAGQVARDYERQYCAAVDAARREQDRAIVAEKSHARVVKALEESQANCERLRALLREWVRVQQRYPNSVAAPGSLLDRTESALDKEG